jgi:hypothetical protein
MTASDKPAKPKKRGRPSSHSNRTIREADRTIARTLYRMRSWGYSMRSEGSTPGAAELVGMLAQKLLRRCDSDGLPLGPDRIEQILEEWLSSEDGWQAEPGGWLDSAGKKVRAFPWTYVKVRTRDSRQGCGLVDRRPKYIPGRQQSTPPEAAELITVLLQHSGVWPYPLHRLWGDDALKGAPQARWEKAPRPAKDGDQLADPVEYKTPDNTPDDKAG